MTSTEVTRTLQFRAEAKARDAAAQTTTGRWQAKRSGKYLSPGVFKSATGSDWRVMQSGPYGERDTVIHGARTAAEAIAMSGFNRQWSTAFAVEWVEE